MAVITGDNSANTLNGTAGPDFISGLGGPDTIYGLGGPDTLLGGGGSDFLFGGAGIDHLFGGAGVDFLFGGPGADNLQGDGGGDFLAGEQGNDSLTGGAGPDLFFFQQALNNGRDTIHDYAAVDIIGLQGNLSYYNGVVVQDNQDTDFDGFLDDVTIQIGLNRIDIENAAADFVNGGVTTVVGLVTNADDFFLY